MNLAIEGKSYLVTGGSSGIGLATARLLLAEGALVTICGRDRDRLDRASAELASDCLASFAADVLDPDAAARAVGAARSHGGRLDGVAAIAGRGRFGSLLELDTADVVEEIAAKIGALLNVVRPALPALIESGGAVVGLTAPTAFRPDPPMGAIGSARAALASAMATLALELAPSGVRVNAVGVGLIDTPRQRERHRVHGDEAGYDEWIHQQAIMRGVPQRRAGTADEVASAIAFLLAPISGHTTGSVLDVTGGLPSR